MGFGGLEMGFDIMVWLPPRFYARWRGDPKQLQLTPVCHLFPDINNVTDGGHLHRHSFAF